MHNHPAIAFHCSLLPQGDESAEVNAKMKDDVPEYESHGEESIGKLSGMPEANDAAVNSMTNMKRARTLQNLV